ncbi:antibiotic biosynthesis monooxygenase [Ruegeria halocynthiae]|uniref:antibiotic biosynthesis monooxygenase n=1 Tax=Ruegeria halocynthiae TaxID=985054 RepID=UPI0031845BE4
MHVRFYSWPKISVFLGVRTRVPTIILPAGGIHLFLWCIQNRIVGEIIVSVPQIVTVVGYMTILGSHAAAFRENCSKMIELRRQEPGHLASAYSFGASGKVVSREDYDNADAVIRHMELGNHIFELTQQLVEITGVELHGPQAELEKLGDLFKGMSPAIFETEFGFRR